MADNPSEAERKSHTDAHLVSAISDLTLNQTSNGSGEYHEVIRPVKRNGLSKPTIDITAVFRGAAAELDTGELIKDEWFTLFDSVGALEIGDAKMDSGHLEPGETLEDDYDTLRELLPEELIGIMDSLLGLQVAWQSGTPLSQTVLASVYIENILWPEPKTLEDATFRTKTGHKPPLNLYQNVLRVYCLLLLKTCDHIMRSISDSVFFEEEDFFTALYNRTLLTAFTPHTITSLVADVKVALEAEALRETSGKGYHDAILSRIGLQTCFLRATEDALAPVSEAMLYSWKLLLQVNDEIKLSSKLGKAVPEAVSYKIQRKLASSVPPRPIVESNIDEATRFMDQLCLDAIRVEELADCRNLTEVMNFVNFFQAQNPQPSVYIRYLLQKCIQREFPWLGNLNIHQDDALAILNEADRSVYVKFLWENMADIRQEGSPISIATTKFADMAAKALWSLVRGLTMNRARTRRMLCHSAVEWDDVQLELEDLDLEMRKHTGEEPLAGYEEELWQYPLSSWAYDIKLRQLLQISQLGFELEIYHKDELSMCYWNQQWLCSVRHSHIERILLFVKDIEQKLRSKKDPNHARIKLVLETLNYQIDQTIAIAALSEAFSCFYHVLTLLHALPTSPLPYSTPELRHSLRNKPYADIIHPPMPDLSTTLTTRQKLFTSLLKSSQSDPSKSSRKSLSPTHQESLALLDHIDALCKISRKSWVKVLKTDPHVASAECCVDEWEDDINRVMRTAVTLGINAGQVGKWIVIEGGKMGSRVEVDVNMGEGSGLVHPAWVLPKVRFLAGEGRAGDGVLVSSDGKKKGKLKQLV